MSPFWFRNADKLQSCNAANLAITVPMIERLGLIDIIDRHVPCDDPRLKVSFGRSIALLACARLSKATPLYKIEEWAEAAGADLMLGIDIEHVNDDRIGRALDEIFEHRHSILACLAMRAADEFGIPLDELHFDPTHIQFYGEYKNSGPRETFDDDDEMRIDGRLQPAHITKGRHIDGMRRVCKTVHVDLLFATDEYGGVPIFAHVQSGNENGISGISETLSIMREKLPIARTMVVGDAGTFSARQIKRATDNGMSIVLGFPRKIAKIHYETRRAALQWFEASYLSQEQQRRRECNSSMPLEHYELAETPHVVHDRHSKTDIPCRLIFVRSSVGIRKGEEERKKHTERIREHLEALRRSVADGCRNTDETSVARRASTALGNGQASKYFEWRLVPLTESEIAAQPKPKPGKRRPTHRFEFEYHPERADADALTDGISAIVTTLGESISTDEVFTIYKRQCHSELANKQLKGPIEISPIWLKKPERVEALIFVLTISMMIYYLIQHEYRRNVDRAAAKAERRMTTKRIFYKFNSFGLIFAETEIGQVVTTTRLTKAQREILRILALPPPEAQLKKHLESLD